MKKIKIKDFEVCITGIKDDDFISLTDLARIKNSKEPKDVIKNWLRLRSTLEYLGLWEKLNNENFKGVEFDPLLNEAGKNSFTMSPTRWINEFNAIGLKTKPTKNGGTFAHRDIALEFASWISPEVRLYVIKEFQRLKTKESKDLEWAEKRLFVKLNYLLHTEAIKEKLSLIDLGKEQISAIYANEADLLNVALFGVTAKQWTQNNAGLQGNIREYANIIELAILSNLEFYNSKLIKMDLSSCERLKY